MPPVPAFYSLPTTNDDIVNQTVARALELFDIEVAGIKRWDGLGANPTPPSEELERAYNPMP